MTHSLVLEAMSTSAPAASSLPKQGNTGGGSATATAVSFDRLTRLDHRHGDQLRAFNCEQGLLHQADGSARFTHGHTSVLTAVYGPMECARSSQDLIEGACVEVVFNSAVDDDVQKNKECSEVLRRTFEPIVLRALHPRTLLRIVVQVIKDDGSAMAVATNSVCMALLDAGFPMKTFAVGVSCLARRDALTLDPTLAEERTGEVRLRRQNAAPSHTIAHHARGGRARRHLTRLPFPPPLMRAPMLFIVCVPGRGDVLCLRRQHWRRAQLHSQRRDGRRCNVRTGPCVAGQGRSHPGGIYAPRSGAKV